MNIKKQKIFLKWLNFQYTEINFFIKITVVLGLIIGLVTVIQSYLLSDILNELILNFSNSKNLINNKLIYLLFLFILRSILNFLKDKVGFIFGSLLRKKIRSKILDKMDRLGYAWIQSKQSGHWHNMLIEHVESIHDFYSYYLPQIYLSLYVPLMILIIIFPINWIVGLILLITAPLIPILMIIVGIASLSAYEKNFIVLNRLSKYFLDRLRGLETLKFFYRIKSEQKNIYIFAKELRKRTMKILKLAFISSSVIDLFSSISITIIALYFYLSYLGTIKIHYFSNQTSLFIGLLSLMLAPEFFQPLRDLGMLYHSKTQAINAAESLMRFLNYNNRDHGTGTIIDYNFTEINLVANNLFILTTNYKKLLGPINFEIKSGKRIALIGASGSGKSSLLNVLLGFLPYSGSLLINGVEFKSISLSFWRKKISWVNQNLLLPEATIRDNILIGTNNISNDVLTKVINDTYIKEFLIHLPNGLDSIINNDIYQLSAGQIQRIALARALIRTPQLLLLDEPTANLDNHSKKLIMKSLKKFISRQTTILVTHQLNMISSFDIVLMINNGLFVQYDNNSNISFNRSFVSKLIYY
ncbi:MAG: thiol reductant ABC exporter subunit CydD [Enterobacterales bacterium]